MVRTISHAFFSLLIASLGKQPPLADDEDPYTNFIWSLDEQRQNESSSDDSDKEQADEDVEATDSDSDGEKTTKKKRKPKQKSEKAEVVKKGWKEFKEFGIWSFVVEVVK